MGWDPSIATALQVEEVPRTLVLNRLATMAMVLGTTPSRPAAALNTTIQSPVMRDADVHPYRISAADGINPDPPWTKLGRGDSAQSGNIGSGPSNRTYQFPSGRESLAHFMCRAVGQYFQHQTGLMEQRIVQHAWSDGSSKEHDGAIVTALQWEGENCLSRGL